MNSPVIITHYQIDDGTCRFIYLRGSTYTIVSVDNYFGMEDFLRYSTAAYVDPTTSISGLAVSLNQMAKPLSTP